MNQRRKCLQVGTAAILCALLVRLLAMGNFLKMPLTTETLAAAIVFLETGRVVQPAGETAKTQPAETVPTQPGMPKPEQALPVAFYPGDSELVELRNYSGYDVALPTFLQQPLSWDLTAEEPTVLIIHTHATESYVNQEGYAESSPYRTLDTQYNMLSVGDQVAALLEQGGISVLHDRTLHDYPSYNGAYSQSRNSLSQYLEAYPSIRLVLDLHRDSVTDSAGQQLGYTLETPRGTAAQLMLVVGSDSGGLSHPDWRDNLSLAVKLQAQLEKVCPGLCRPISLRESRFNQDLYGEMLLVEVGAAGNSRQEALLAAEYLAQAVLSLAQGSQFQG